MRHGLERTRATYEQDLAIARQVGDRRREAHAFASLPNARAAPGELQRAFGYIERALASVREIGDRRGEGQDLGNLGTAYGDLGDPGRAAVLMLVLVDYEREIGHPDAEKHAVRLALVRARLGQGRAGWLRRLAARIRATSNKESGQVG